jgi:hypothetical protein
VVDDDHAAQTVFGRSFHHAPGHEFDTVFGVNNNGRGLDGWQNGDTATGKVRVSGRIYQVDVDAFMLHRANGSFQGMAQFFFVGIEIANRAASLNGSSRVDGPGFFQQCFGQRGFAGRTVTDKGYVADIRRLITTHGVFSFLMF